MRGLSNTPINSAVNKLNKSPFPAVELVEVSKSYGSIQAITKVSFTVSKGTIFGLVGSDGAGKTTILRMIATMIPPSSGKILLEGMDVIEQSLEVKHRIGYMPQRFGLYPDLTVFENIQFFMDIFGIFGEERKKRLEKYLGFSNLLPFLDRKAKDLSGGMKQKLGLACVLVHEPSVLILDEPTNGVDPVSRQEFWEMLLTMRNQGMTIIISTAYLDEGEKCDRLLLMHKSKVLIEASPKDIQASYESLEEAMIRRIQEVDEELAHDAFQW